MPEKNGIQSEAKPPDCSDCKESSCLHCNQKHIDLIVLIGYPGSEDVLLITSQKEKKDNGPQSSE